jgi:beta-lactamase class A
MTHKFPFIKIILIITALTLFQVGFVKAQYEKLLKKVDSLAKGTTGKIGFQAELLETGENAGYNQDQHFVMQSVFKFPIAVMLLSEVDAGKLDLNKKIFIPKSKLHKTVSKLYDKYPEGNVSIPLLEILQDMLVYSDNNACDVILELLGGGKILTQYLHRHGIKEIEVKFNEAQMHVAWGNQYANWCSPNAQINLLKKVFDQSILKAQSNTLLRDLMRETYVAPKRIRYNLPKLTPVEHRSGTSSTNNKGLSPATNDVGIITLPDGKHLSIAIFLMDSYENAEKRDSVIAAIAKATFDEFSR